MDDAFEELTPVQESLFLTLYLRALDCRSAAPILGDRTSAELAGTIDYDFTRQKVQRSQVRDLALRTKTLDDLVVRFSQRHRDAVVLDLGCGLDPRVLRCSPPSEVDWYDIDFPAVAAIRERYLPGISHVVGADLTTPGWLSGIPTDRPAMVGADGLMAFLTGDAYRAMTRALTGDLSTGEFSFNAYTALDLRLAGYSPTFRALHMRPVGEGFTDPRTPESWGAGLTLIEEVLLVRAPEVAKYPEPLRTFTRLCARSSRVARHGNRVVRYAF